MPDFTLNTYLQLLDRLVSGGYQFQTFASYLEQPLSRVIMLRHDIDDRKQHALLFAKMQHERNILGSYYFRMVPQSFDPGIIREIAAMGHEIGYHYETMDTSGGDIDLAYREFCQNLETLRKLAEIRTICMHGSPRSPFDNKEIWKKYNYRQLDIKGEPYFDLDFNRVAYLTDTGRKWNGDKVSVRDKVKGGFNFDFRTTGQLIGNAGKLPDRVMLTFHPQRWTNQPVLWVKELVMQNLKNEVKRFLIRKREN